MGLIIVDEEHETSYKQIDPSPRYNARDVASKMAQIHNSKLLLGSATPSMEMMELVEQKKIGYVVLDKRYHDVSMPEIQCADLKVAHRKKKMRGIFTPMLLEAIQDTIRENKRHSTEQVAYDALNWLDNKRDKDKPFMLMYQFKAPLRPWTPNSKFDSLFIDDLPYPDSFNDDYEGRLAASENMLEIENHMNRKDLKLTPPKGLSKRELGKWNRFGNNGEFWTPNDTLQGLDLKKWKYQRYIKDYLRCVAGVDESVGKMLDYLKENNLDENTIVIYTSDQGFYLGEHGWFDKRWMYEPSFRMPFMIKYPKKIKPKSINNELIVNVDFAPTILDLAGIKPPKDMQGESFKKQLFDKKYAKRDAVYYHYYEYPFWHKVQPHYGVRTERYKLIHYYYNMNEWELFDLDNDKDEINNLYGKQGYDDIIEDLKQELKKLQSKYKDDMSLEDMRKMTDTRIKRVYTEMNSKK